MEWDVVRGGGYNLYGGGGVGRNFLRNMEIGMQSSKLRRFNCKCSLWCGG